jgi:hypothetical protein
MVTTVYHTVYKILYTIVTVIFCLRLPGTRFLSVCKINLSKRQLFFTTKLNFGTDLEYSLSNAVQNGTWQ